MKKLYIIYHITEQHRGNSTGFKANDAKKINFNPYYPFYNELYNEQLSDQK